MPKIGHTVSLSLSPSLSISVPHKSNEDWKQGNLIFFLLFSFFTVHQFHFLDGALCRSIHCRVSSDISPKVPNTSDCSMCQPHSMGSLGPSDGSSLYVRGHLDSPGWRWIIIFTKKMFSKFKFHEKKLQIFVFTRFFFYKFSIWHYFQAKLVTSFGQMEKEIRRMISTRKRIKIIYFPTQQIQIMKVLKVPEISAQELLPFTVWCWALPFHYLWSLSFTLKSCSSSGLWVSWAYV